MNKSKLVQLVKHLSAPQKDRFLKYLNSPYFVSSYEEAQQRTISFTKYLYHEVATENEDIASLQKMNVWRFLFTNKPYNDTRMRQEMTHLTKELEKFLGIENIQNQSEAIDISLLEYYASHQNLHPFFKGVLNKIHRQLETDITYKSSAFYYHLFKIQRAVSSFDSLQPISEDHINLQKTIFSLDLYYLISKLEYACLWVNYHQTSQTQSLIEESLILEISENKAYDEYPILKIYRFTLLILKGQFEAQNINEYIELLKNHLHEFYPKDAKTLFTYAYNYLIININQTTDEQMGNQFRERLYELYIEVGLKQNILYVDDKLLPNDLKNIITLTLSLPEQGEWNRERKIRTASNLLQQHEHLIWGTEQNAYYHYNLAHLQFYEQDYLLAIQTISTIELSNINYVLAARRLKIKAYYELDNIDELEREINSFRTAMYRKSIEGAEITEQVKSYNMQFIKLLKRILHPKTYKNKTRIQKLIDEIQEAKLIADRKWLVEQLEELR